MRYKGLTFRVSREEGFEPCSVRTMTVGVIRDDGQDDTFSVRLCVDLLIIRLSHDHNMEGLRSAAIRAWRELADKLDDASLLHMAQDFAAMGLEQSEFEVRPWKPPKAKTG